jgi:ATPase subunit of ABC transporter with duplicated ATPase domains
MSRINLTIQDLSLSVGRNGSGKSTLLHALASIAGDTALLVPQIITEHNTLSGGQRFNKALSAGLTHQPEILLLDEPTNHLDVKNRQSLLRMLNAFDGTLIIVTHDIELLRTCISTIWHLEDGHITVSNQSYDEYIRTTEQKRTALTKRISLLNRQKKEAHATLMKEQERAKKKKAQGTKAYAHDDKLLKRHKQASGQLTGNKKRSAITTSKEEALAALAGLQAPQHIIPTFTLPAASHAANTLVTITDGSVGYAGNPVLSKISLTIHATERIALMGANGSGKLP